MRKFNQGNSSSISEQNLWTQLPLEFFAISLPALIGSLHSTHFPLNLAFKVIILQTSLIWIYSSIMKSWFLHGYGFSMRLFCLSSLYSSSRSTFRFLRIFWITTIQTIYIFKALINKIFCCVYTVKTMIAVY